MFAHQDWKAGSIHQKIIKNQRKIATKIVKKNER